MFFLILRGEKLQTVDDGELEQQTGTREQLVSAASQIILLLKH